MTAPGAAGEERIRVVIATPGDDGEDRATGTLARGLRDAGMEVVQAGRSSLEQLADTVVQEDADAVGLPVLPADAPEVLARLRALLADRGVHDVVVFGCGADAELPRGTRLSPPGTAPAEVAGWLRGQLIGEPPWTPRP
ncbi:methylmalonyl-CoA mutase, C-terminal domain [Geodermatophilus obscurus]|uniref:Methylmalonyl-CoA mutase, C-terminal domain n=1 Tax=Geodermatophilus obscurus TaxID=1861 RepID=A0A1M7UIN9_9ACTN|nr:methylmalonyl-CoA mutase, C-terminal domain [Geodermatophilus obscurus]